MSILRRIVIELLRKYEIGVYDSAALKNLGFSHSYDPVKVMGQKEFFDGMTFKPPEQWIRPRRSRSYRQEHDVFRKFKGFQRRHPLDSDGNIRFTPILEQRTTAAVFRRLRRPGKFLGRVRVERDVLFRLWHRRSPIVDGCFWAVECSNEESPGRRNTGFPRDAPSRPWTENPFLDVGGSPPGPSDPVRHERRWAGTEIEEILKRMIAGFRMKPRGKVMTTKNKWHKTVADDQLKEGKPLGARAGTRAVVLTRSEGRICAMGGK
jgi:hypothetical protein